MRRELGFVLFGSLLGWLASCGHHLDARSRRVVVPHPGGPIGADDDYRYPRAACDAPCPKPGAGEQLDACYAVGADESLAPGTDRLMICQYLERP